MLKIRLKPIGKMGQRSYKILVMDARKPRDSGNYLDDLGHWNPNIKEFKLNQEKYEMWLNKGAQPTARLSSMCKEDSVSYRLSFIREKIINWLKSLSEEKIEISLPETNFKPSKIEGLNWEIINFSALDLKNKLKEDNYQLIRKRLPISWAKEEELVKKVFKELKIEAVLSRARDDGKMSVIEDERELPSLLRPFNFEFSVANSEKKYSTRNNPLHIVEPEPKEE